ncbi:MAG: malonyl-CoA decarboxylase family protein, partial [Pseudomonadota bacterium]
MSRFTALGDLLGSVLERGSRLVGLGAGAADAAGLAACADALMSTKGEASGVALATEVLEGYGALDADGRLAFFTHLADAFDPDPEEVTAAASAYAADQTSDALDRLFRVTEPPRQELLRRLNMAPGGTERLVAMRADLLGLVREHPGLKRIDNDFRHLLGSWFNRGFLVLRPIDWETPAAMLEKIIAYEAVHEIGDWDELRRRVAPPDRRCFAFFHPSMPDEPLIFVEVALTREIPGSIQGLLDPERDPLDPGEATTA